MSERRKFMRFDVALDALCRLLNNPVSKANSTLKNLSKEGLRLIGKSPLEKGSIVELELKIPGDNIPIFAFGEVAWAHETKTTECDAGIRFTKIKNEDRVRLLDFVYDKWVNAKKDKNPSTHTRSERPGTCSG